MGIDRLKIATKLWLFIVVILAFLVIVAGVGLVRSAGILAEGRARQDVAFQLVQVTTQWNGLTETNAVRNQAMILSGEASVNAAFKDAVTATSDQITVLQKKLESVDWG